MFRIDSDGSVEVIPTPKSAGTPGFFSEGNPSTGQKATVVSADWLNAVQEEIANAIETRGGVLSKTTRNQLAKAMTKKKLLVVEEEDLTIDADDLDEVFFVRTGNTNRTITLPPSAQVQGVPLLFKKTDIGFGIVNIVRSGSDTIEGATSVALEKQNDLIVLVADGSIFRVISGGAATISSLGLRQETKARLFSMMNSGGINMVALGDSTESGSGNGSDSPYGECRADVNGSHAQRIAYALMVSDPNFYPVDNQHWQIAVPLAPAISTESISNGGFSNLESSRPYPSWNLTKAVNPTVRFYLKNANRVAKDTLTVYVMERTSDAAAKFRITVDETGGGQLAQETIDTYVAPVSFGQVATDVPVGLRIAKRTVSLSSSARNVRITIDNVDTEDRGNGVAADGTAVILGFAFGDGVFFRNLAVSSTTLTEGSQANLERGVDTSERLAEAKSLDANVFIIGWGTNDSKTGVTTVEAFKTEYLALIDSIREEKPEAIIILSTDPEGEEGSIYENNPAYNQVIRQVAKEKDCDLLDVETLFKSLPDSNYNDSVHPSNEGYDSIAKYACALLGLKYPGFSTLVPRNLEAESGEELISETGNSDFTGSTVKIGHADVVKPSWARGILVGAKLCLARSNSDLDDCALSLQLGSGHDDIGLTVLDESYVRQAQVSSTAACVVPLVASYTFSSLHNRNYRIAVFGKNYQIRQSDAISKIWWKWLR